MLVQQRPSGWYIRLVCPTDLRGRLGLREVVRSLRTKSHREAVRRSYPLEFAIRLAFDEARRDPMVDRKKLNELVDRLADVAVDRVESTLTIRSQVAPDPARAYADALQRRLQPSAEVSPSPVPAANEGPRLSASVESYCALKVSQKAWTERTEEMHRGMYAELVSILGDPPVASITKADLLTYQQAIAKLPISAAKRWPGLDTRQVLDETAALDVPRLSPKSQNKRLVAVKSLFGWMALADVVERDPSVVLQAVPEGRPEDARLPLSNEEVRAFIAKCEEQGTEAAHRWLPKIAAYGGLRLDEAGQLQRDDVVQVDGIWCFKIEAGEGRKIKTANAARLVPIHSAILGDLLAYREGRPKGNLWGLTKGKTGYTANVGKWFARRLDKIVDDRRKTFHSMRHTIATALKTQGVEEYLIAQLLGHANASITSGRYGKNVPVATLRDVVERIAYHSPTPKDATSP
jgi:integrase